MQLLSDGALYLAGAQATSADVDALHLSVHYGADALNIRIPAAFCLQMGMADIHAAHDSLIADFTNMCHVTHLLTTADGLSYTTHVILS